MKKTLGFLALTLLLTSCTAKPQETTKFKIGISQIIQHNALDEAKKGFMDRLNELGIEAEFQEQNAQGELPKALTIAQQFKTDNVDLVYAISTPSAQAAMQALNNEIPIVFSAVTDPVAANLVESLEKNANNITGTSDAAPIKEQLQLFNQIDPTIKTIGIIFSTSETNSEIQIKEIEKIAPTLNLTVKTVGVSNISEIPSGMEVLLGQVDAVYMITDNLISSASELVASKTTAAGKISICAEENILSGGALITSGASYYAMGVQCGDMAAKILKEKVKASDIPVEFAKEIHTKFNPTTAQTLAIDTSKEPFKSATEFTK